MTYKTKCYQTEMYPAFAPFHHLYKSILNPDKQSKWHVS